MPARLLPAGAGALALFRRLFLEKLMAAHEAGRLHFFSNHVPLGRRASLRGLSGTAAQIEWWSMPRGRSAGPKPCWPILALIPPLANPNSP